jgi:hypothetical protein
MGTITRSFANNITTSGVLLPSSLTNSSIANVTAYNAAISAGNMVLLSSQTASASATISFTTGIDSTYKEYQFYFINLHPSIESTTAFQFNLSTDGGASYNVTKTTTFYYAAHNEDDDTTALTYATSQDLAQSTSFQTLVYDIGNDNDQNICGDLTLFNPSSTTYVKHFISRSLSGSSAADYVLDSFIAGYGNTTSAVNAIQFKMNSGNIDDGTILMYGIK